MKHFELVDSNLDTGPLLNEIKLSQDVWNLNTGRQNKIAVQREAQAVPLRGLVKSKMGDRRPRDVHESRWTTISKDFPLFREFLIEFAASQNAQLGRAKIVRLPPGRKVYPHIDQGQYYEVRDRFHYVLKSTLGSWMKSGDEEMRMQERELWCFDNHSVHEARNDGEDERIHLIFDLETQSSPRFCE